MLDLYTEISSPQLPSQLGGRVGPTSVLNDGLSKSSDKDATYFCIYGSTCRNQQSVWRLTSTWLGWACERGGTGLPEGLVSVLGRFRGGSVVEFAGRSSSVDSIAVRSTTSGACGRALLRITSVSTAVFMGETTPGHAEQESHWWQREESSPAKQCVQWQGLRLKWKERCTYDMAVHASLRVTGAVIMG